MIIEIHKLSKEKRDFDFSLERSECSRLDHSIQFKDSMKCKAELNFLKEGLLSLDGNYSVTLDCVCDVCLSKFSYTFENEFSIKLSKDLDSVDINPDGSIDVDEDIAFYDGEEIDLPKYFVDQLIIDLPFSLKCETFEGLNCSYDGESLDYITDTNDSPSSNNPFQILKQKT